MLFNEVFHLLFLQYLLNYEFKNYGIEVVYPSTRVSATGASSSGFCLFLFGGVRLVQCTSLVYLRCEKGVGGYSCCFVGFILFLCFQEYLGMYSAVLVPTPPLSREFWAEHFRRYGDKLECAHGGRPGCQMS